VTVGDAAMAISRLFSFSLLSVVTAIGACANGGTGLGLAITQRDKVTSSHSHWSPLGSIHESRAHLGRMAEAGDPAEEFSLSSGGPNS